MSDNTNWKKVSDFFNGVIEEASDKSIPEEETRLELHIFSPAFGETMLVHVPSRNVEDFMRRLGLWNAQVKKGYPTVVK